MIEETETMVLLSERERETDNTRILIDRVYRIRCSFELVERMMEKVPFPSKKAEAQ